MGGMREVEAVQSMAVAGDTVQSRVTEGSEDH